MSRHFAVPLTLAQAAKRRFALPLNSDHGPQHWARVAWYARHLSHAMGESERVPVLFALLHDCCREKDIDDPEHGHRAEDFVLELSERSEWPLDEAETRLLRVACRDHSEGLRRAPVVVQICWDADRLDLGRVGILPAPDRLCTWAACDEVRLTQARHWSQGQSQRGLR